MTDLDDLTRLKRLHDQGALNYAEYEREKALLNAGVSAAAAAAPPQLEPTPSPWANRLVWFGLSAAVILIIGAYFIGKGAALAGQRGELGQAAASAAANGNDNGIAQLCMLAPFMKLESLNYTASDLAALAVEAGRSVTWESTAQGAILRIRYDDPLEGRSHEIGTEFIRTANASPQTNCAGATEGAVARRVIIDGKVFEGLSVGVFFQQAFAKPSSSPRPSTSQLLPEPSEDAGPMESEAAMPQRAPTELTGSQQRLIARYRILNEKCRDSTADDVVCAERNRAEVELNRAGVCWGKEDQYEAEYEYLVCKPGSLGYAQSPQGRGQGQ